MTGTIPPSFVTLANRGLITVTGPDAFKFLQNLITNDLSKLKDRELLYSCLLSPQGKFLHDFFISKSDDAYLLDCEGGTRTVDLARRLGLYKMRASITIESREENDVFAVFPAGGEYDDPRNIKLGSRSFEKPDLPEMPFSFWDKIRIALALPDGSRDAELEKSTLAELNIADLAVAYDKGCYVGQELTAKMHFRGMAKKRLYTVRLSGSPPDFGEIRSVCDDTGLMLIKNDVAENLPQNADGFILA